MQNLFARTCMQSLVCASVFGMVSTVHALEYQNSTASIPIGEMSAIEYKSSLGSVVIESKNLKGEIVLSRCIASITDSKWLTLASHCVASETATFVKGMFVLGNNTKQIYDIDLVVAPKSRTKLQGDGTDLGKNSQSVANDYSMVRVSNPMENITPIPICSVDTSIPTSPYLAKAVFFGANNVDYKAIAAVSKSFLVGESIAYVTPNQTIIHTAFGAEDEFTALWNSKNPTPFTSSIESNIEKGDSGSPVILKDKNCQIGVVSYIGKYHYQNPLTGKASQIQANFSSTIQSDDLQWSKDVRSKFSDNNQLSKQGIVPSITQVPVVEY
jgi:Trypsin